MKDVQILPGANIDLDHNLLIAKFCAILKKIINFQKGNLDGIWRSYMLNAESARQSRRRTRAIECESVNMELQFNNIKKSVLDTMSDLVGKVDRKTRKPWIAKEMFSKMDGRRKWRNINNEEGKKKCRMLRDVLKRSTCKDRRNILLAYMPKLWSFKEQDVMI
jgi:malate synthase